MLRWPAEWEAQSGCFVGYPDHESEWGPMLEPARNAVVRLCTELGAMATLCVARSSLEVVRDRVGSVCQVERLNYGDIWLRDTGPVWLVDDDRRQAVTFRWTGWGGSYFLDGDEDVGAALAERLAARHVASYLACEGGALETDGRGACLTTRDCLLNANRNPGRTEAEVEDELGKQLGVEKIAWFERGLANDHTDGHIDNLARFVAPGIVVAAHSPSDDPNHDVHSEVFTNLEALGFDVVPLPSPGAVCGYDSELQPASYLNFVIGNDVVCVPTFERDSDDAALAAIVDLFPTRRVVGIDARALLYGGGALHCLSNHVPSLNHAS